MSEKRKGDETVSPQQKKKRKNVSFVFAAVYDERLEENVELITKAWLSNEPLDAELKVQIEICPFKHCIVDDFLIDKGFLRGIASELTSLYLLRKKNDLYQYDQSRDLFAMSGLYIDKLKKFLVEDCRELLEKFTGFDLDEKVSATLSSYSHTDHLLCHDDKCEDRRIAFILYLNENWSEDKGGQLQLFDTGIFGEPTKVVKSIDPLFNRLVFFEVTDSSFHQVSEVVSPDYTRLSINGWFHGYTPSESTREDMDRTLFRRVAHPLEIDDSVLNCVNPIYLTPNIKLQIGAKFEEGSEILLPNFLKAEFYEELCKSLSHEPVLLWKEEGPPNRRRYETLASGFPAPVTQLVNLFTSEQFFKLLEQFTHLELIPDSAENICRPYCNYEVQQWRPGYYTLLHDDLSTKEVLDVLLYFNVGDIERFQGGHTSFIDREDNEELLTIDPTPNALCLTYKDKNTLSFVNYINSYFNSTFQAVNFTYCEMSQFTN